MISKLGFLGAAIAALPGVVLAQTDEPLSAIDWLSDVIQPGAGTGGAVIEQGVATDAGVGSVSVMAIDAPRADAIGLLPPNVTGFSADMWRGSSSTDVAARLRATPIDLLPGMQEVLYRLLLAELDPPADAGPEAALLLARVDTLLALGAVEQAQALTNRLVNPTPQLFRRMFDISLLLHDEADTCAMLRQTPGLSPTFQARIYCLARGGDWSAAALSLETGRALGFVTQEQDPLLSRFLELGLAPETGPLLVQARPTPLEFRMYEAIGRPLPTNQMPRAFAHTDLHSSTGWKNQIAAAERLVQTGAVDMNQLLGLYRLQKPAGSGGVWNRATAIQSLDGALLAQSLPVLSTALRAAWEAMRSIELEVPFARAYCTKITGRALDPSALELRDMICLLAGQSGVVAIDGEGISPLLMTLAANAGTHGAPAKNLQAALARGFAGSDVPVRLQSLVAQGRQGEALLRAIEMFQNGANGDLDELSDAIAFMRAVGLQDLVQRASVELVLLDRRG